MVYVSTQTFQSSMRQPIMQSESALSNAQQEVSSGVYADLGLQLGAQTGFAISLAQQSNHFTALTASNVTANTRLSATTTALSNIMSDAQSMSENLISGASSPSVLQDLQSQAQSSLENVAGQINTSVGGQYIFAGTNTDTAPLASASTLEAAGATGLAADVATAASSGTALGTVISGSSGALSTQFQGSGWTSLSKASSSTLSSQISPSATATTSVSGNQTAFQQITQAYAMLNAAASQSLTQQQGQDVITQAEALLSSGITSLTALQANIGVTQSAITNADTSMAAQQTILTQNVGSLEDVDTYALSTKVTSLQTQLQDSFSLTSQLKTLSLVNYLSAG